MKVHQTSCGSAYRHSPAGVTCHIVAAVKRRTGTPKFWCQTHRSPAWNTDGTALPLCPLAAAPTYTDKDILRLHLDDYPGGVALWGALPPVFATRSTLYDRGIHIHARKNPGGAKVIDRTYTEVRITGSLLGVHEIVIREEEAVTFVASSILGQNLK